MAESITIKITNEGLWDGTTAITLTRDDFAQTNRLYKADILSGGRIPGALFGFWEASALKLVSIAADDFSPRLIARVVPVGGTVYRSEIDLSPAYQSVLLAPEDDLVIVSDADGEDRGGTVTLIVNDLSEQQAAEYQLLLASRERMRRYRIIRPAGNNAAFTLAAPPLSPTWTFNTSTRYLIHETAANGSIRISDLVNTQSNGVWVWIRTSGHLLTTNIHQVDARTEQTFELANAQAAMNWAGPFWMGYDDRIAVETGGALVGHEVGIDIEISDITERR